MSCRLIALGKNPGVRPIGVGEVVRHIIAKAVLIFNVLPVLCNSVLANPLVLRLQFTA